MSDTAMRRWYEWSIETIDDSGDIIDNDFDDTMADLLRRHPLGSSERLVLVLSIGSILDGVEDRGWAYIADGKLPEFFDNGIKVPKRFHMEAR